FDEILERFKGRCYINCDKFWLHPREISDRIRAHGMMEQILVKTSPKNSSVSFNSNPMCKFVKGEIGRNIFNFCTEKALTKDRCTTIMDM
ncbi:MAG: hypothetical protein IIU73_04915, partial [Selenomonadales bacterium]|nr:hypothetical protein [Selenomonadales bacterium]